MCCPVAVKLPELLLRLLSGAGAAPRQRNISGSERGESGTSSSVVWEPASSSVVESPYLFSGCSIGFRRGEI